VPRNELSLASVVATARQLHLRAPSSRIALIDAYLDTLMLWRERLSLTGTRTRGAIIANHIIDSLHVAPRLMPGQRVADIGSGAGFPGIVLAIMLPDTPVTLIESRRKRANFLREVVRRTHLDNATVVEGRAETAPGSLRESFDVIVSRALGPLAALLEHGRLLLRPGGLAIAMKGTKGRAEAGVTIPGFSEPEIIEYTLNPGIPRYLLISRKVLA
jgi:16S rRNA (guanine(527)-N(7))-methyltransferase RsmG